MIAVESLLQFLIVLVIVVLLVVFLRLLLLLLLDRHRGRKTHENSDVSLLLVLLLLRTPGNWLHLFPLPYLFFICPHHRLRRCCLTLHLLLLLLLPSNPSSPLQHSHFPLFHPANFLPRQSQPRLQRCQLLPHHHHAVFQPFSSPLLSPLLLLIFLLFLFFFLFLRLGGREGGRKGRWRGEIPAEGIFYTRPRPFLPSLQSSFPLLHHRRHASRPTVLLDASSRA